MRTLSAGILVFLGILGCATRDVAPPPGEVFAKVILYVDS